MSNPFRGRPSAGFWSSGVSGQLPGRFDPVGEVGFRLSATDKVATLGSCFAQHLARSIQAAGYHYLVQEHAPSGADPEQVASYGVFSARYGNIYTVRQAVQLLDRAFDGRIFQDTVWQRGGRWHDAFRPTVEPRGFASLEVLLADREQHLDAVRQVFLEADVIVFTLGLTEGWVSQLDGATYPVAPGVAAGAYDSSRHAFVNFDYGQVRADLTSWIGRVREINSNVRILLTVSPVPLAATFEDRNVWASTTYSKATLLAVAYDVARTHKNVDYFPSYEIVTNPLVQGRYYADDLRSVTDGGVAHVMRIFQDHYFGDGEVTAAGFIDEPEPIQADIRQLDEVVAVICDDDLLDAPDLRRTPGD